jgi:hypothetical protein
MLAAKCAGIFWRIMLPLTVEIRPFRSLRGFGRNGVFRQLTVVVEAKAHI